MAGNKLPIKNPTDLPENRVLGKKFFLFFMHH